MARQFYVNKKKLCSNEKIFARFLGLAKYNIETCKCSFKVVQEG